MTAQKLGFKLEELIHNEFVAKKYECLREKDVNFW